MCKQKKIINTTTANGISKIPKPLATKADSSRLSVAPKCVVQPAKRPKCNQNAPPGCLSELVMIFQLC